MPLTKAERQTIDAAIAEKQSSPYVKGYQAAVREIQFMAASGMTTEQIVKALAEPHAREGERG